MLPLRPCDCSCKIRKAYELHFHLRNTLYQSLLLLPRPLGSSVLKILLHHFIEEFLFLFRCHVFQCSDHHFWFELCIVHLGAGGICRCFCSDLRDIVPVVHYFRGSCIGSWGERLFLSSLRAISGHVSLLSVAEAPSFSTEVLLFFVREWF